MRNRQARRIRKLAIKKFEFDFKDAPSLPKVRVMKIDFLGPTVFYCRINPIRQYKKAVLESLKKISKVKPTLSRKQIKELKKRIKHAKDTRK